MSLIQVFPELWWIIMGATVLLGLILEVLFRAAIIVAFLKRARWVLKMLKRA